MCIRDRLRYGENPHQKSAIYSQNQNLKIDKIHGKQLSYNNYNDIFSALTISRSLPKNTGTVIVKHANPCGVSILKDNISSYKSALACDPISAFGGIVSCNFKVKKALARELSKIFLEVVIANGFEKNALKILKSKTEHPKFPAAMANEDFVLVLGSQKTFATVLSGKRSSFLKFPSLSIKLLENVIKSKISFFERS